MHDHDSDLIMALAEGSLDASEAEAAEASIAACDRCSQDLALQRQALAALGAAPRVGLTEIEAAGLRRNLREQLGLSAATQAAAQAAAVTTARRSRFTWTGALSAAAVLLVVVLAAPALNLLTGSSDDAADISEDLFAVASPTSTVAASEDLPAGGSTGDGAEAAPEEAAANLSAEDEASGADTTTTDAATSRAAEFQDDVTLDQVEAAYTNSFTSPDMSAFYPDAAPRAVTDEFDRCADVGAASLSADGETVEDWSFAGLWDRSGSEVAILAYQLDAGDVVVMVHDAATCEILNRS